MNDALRVFVIAYAIPTSSTRWRGLLRVVSYTLSRVSRRGAKALWFQDTRDCHKFTIWNNKTVEWIICLEYLGIGDRFALNLFRLCLDARTDHSQKKSVQLSAGGVGGREARTQGLAPK